MRAAVILMAVLLGVGRVAIAYKFPPESLTVVDIYKDAAHLFVGGLFAAWWIQRQRWQWLLFWILNAIEIVAAIASRAG